MTGSVLNLPTPPPKKPRAPVYRYPRHWAGVRYNGVNAALPDALFNDYDPCRTLKHERPVHRLMVSLVEQGYNLRETARTLGYSVRAVTDVVRQPWARKHIIETMKQEVSGEIRKFLEAEVLPSLRVVRDLRDDPSARPADRLRAAEILVERQLGKPTQPIFNETAGKSVKDMTNDELDAAISRAIADGATPS